MSRRLYTFNAYESGLTSGVSDSDVNFPVDSAVGLSTPMIFCIDPDDPLLREYIRGINITGNVIEIGDTSNRGLQGSAGGIAHPHDSGARVRAISASQWLDNIFDDIEDLEAEQASFLLLDGSRPMAGALNMNSNFIVNLLDPTAPQDATTKVYVDDADAAVVSQLQGEFTAADLLLLPLDGSRAMNGDLQIGDDTSAALVALNLNREDDGTAINIRQSIEATSGKWYVEQIFNGTPFDIFKADTNEMLVKSQILRVGADYPAGGSNIGIRRDVFGIQWDITLATGAPGVGGVGASIAIGQDQAPTVTVAHFGVDATAFPLDVILSGTGTLRSNQSVLQLERDGGVFMQLGADLFNFYFGGVSRSRMYETQWWNPYGTALLPGVSFFGDSDTGMFHRGTNALAFSTQGNERLRVDNLGTYFTTYSASTGSANAVINISDGRLHVNTSSMDVKEDLQVLEDPLDVIRKLNPFNFRSKLPDDDGRRFVGFGAQEVAAVIPEADEGQKNYDHRAILAYCVAAIQKIIE